MQTYAFGGTFETDDLIRAQIGNKIYDFTAGSATTATVVSNLVTTWNALSAADYPEFAEITASANTTTLTLTADTAGKPFTCTLTPLEANGGAADAQTIEGAGTATSGTASTASAGPEDWSTPANWSDGAIPANSDTVWLDNYDGDIKYGLSQSGVTVTALHITSTFTGKLGLPLENTDNTEYPEYRTDYLAIGATTCNIGAGAGQGSRMLKLNFGSVQTTCNVYASSSSDDLNLKAIILKGTHASNAFNIVGGQVDIAPLGGETSTADVLKVGSEGGNAASVRLGAGVTLNSPTLYNGDLEINSAVVTTLTVEGGTCIINGTGAVAQLTARRGFISYLTSGTLGGNTSLADSAILSFDGDLRTKTVTNPIECYGGAQVIDSNKVVAAVAQVTSYLLAGTWEADDLIRVQFTGAGDVSHDFTAGSTTAATIVDNVVAAWLLLSSTTYPEFAKITPSRSSNSLILTAKSAGTPFTCMITPLESDASPSGAQTIEGATTATLGTTSTANATLIVDYNQFNPGLPLGTNIRLYRTGTS